MRRFKRIMVASDLPKVSRGAFNTAIEFARSRGAELRLSSTDSLRQAKQRTLQRRTLLLRRQGQAFLVRLPTTFRCARARAPRRL